MVPVQRTAAVAVAAFALLFFWSQTALFTFRTPDTGATVRVEDARYIIDAIKPGSPADRAGLREGDVVAADASGIGPGDVLFSGEPQPAPRLSRVPVEVKRGNQTLHLSVRPESVGYPGIDRVRIVSRLLSYSVFLVLGTWIVFLRPNIMTWMLFLFCAGAMAPSGDFRDVIDLTFGQTSAPDHVLSGIDVLFPRASIVALPLFALRFPNNSTPGWRGVLFWPLAIVLTLYVVVTWTVAVFFWTEARDGIIGSTDIFLSFLAITILVATYALARGIDRQRLKWGVIGTVVGLFCDIANEFARGISHHSGTGIAVGAAFTVIAIIMPICFAYAINRHEIIDVRFVLNRTVLFSIGLGAFAGVFAILDWLFSYFITQSRAETAIAMGVAFLFGLVARFQRRSLVSFVDRVLFPRHHAAMKLLHDLRVQIERANDGIAVQNLLTDGVATALKLASAAVCVSSDDGGVVRQAATGWSNGTMWHLFTDDVIMRRVRVYGENTIRVPHDAWEGIDVPRGSAMPVLAVPIIAGKQLIALALYGAHSDSTHIDPDEAAAISDVCRAAALYFNENRYVTSLPHAAAAAILAVR